MSRDVFYVVPSESDGRNDQQQQQQQHHHQHHHHHHQQGAVSAAAATTSEPINNQQHDESNSSAVDNDTDQNDSLDSSGEERVRPLIKERVYYAAKDGLPIALTSLLSNVESEATKNAYINQVNKSSFFFEPNPKRKNRNFTI